MKLSIIMGVYNTEKYLSDCLKSILDQQEFTQDDFEVICVNDGSTDNSGKILEEYSKQYTSLKIINQENRGRTAALNVALSEASGKYLWTINSDDFIDTSCFKFIIDTMENNDIDCLVIERVRVPEDAKYIKKTQSYKFREGRRNTSDSSADTTHILLRKLVSENNILYEEDARNGGCDHLYLYELGKYWKKEVYTKSIHYYHRQRANSLAHIRDEKSANNRERTYRLMLEKFNSDLKECKDKKKRRNILERKGLATQSILNSYAINKSKNERVNLLEDLKKDGYYPYDFVWWNLRPKLGIKRTLMDWCMFFFPIQNYYLFYAYVVNKLKNYNSK
ncbi:MAG TPA: glycosyltransferase family 2 protein [Gallicola sp.]|nr:glycosyltransferase family 2 protein [Gallicola sp.]